MKSPYTGKEMRQVFEKRTWKFRGEEFLYYHTAWHCEETGEQFTTDESDTAGFVQVTNQYREKYGIPYTDEIIDVRQHYGFSASMMSKILGIGTNQYRLYEQGEVPSVSNGRLITLVMKPEVMKQMVAMAKNELDPNEYEKAMGKVQSVISDEEVSKVTAYETSRIFSSKRGRENGYAVISLNRLKNILLYVLGKCNETWNTKMNKLLFYIDFLSYRQRGMAMTGLTYKAIEYGPVPDRWERIYSEFPEVKQELRKKYDFYGSVLVPNAKAEQDLFSKEELQIMDMVCSHFGNMSSREISSQSHQETAWINHVSSHGNVSFDEAFTLNGI